MMLVFLNSTDIGRGGNNIKFDIKESSFYKITWQQKGNI